MSGQSVIVSSVMKGKIKNSPSIPNKNFLFFIFPIFLDIRGGGCSAAALTYFTADFANISPHFCDFAPIPLILRNRSKYTQI